MKIKKNQKGFSLVELIIVIAILGLLALLIVPRIIGNIEDAKRSREIANARTLASEIAAYNAKESTKAQPNLITATGQSNNVQQSDLSGKIDTSQIEFPSEAIVLIKIDGNGDVYIEEVP